VLREHESAQHRQRQDPSSPDRVRLIASLKAHRFRGQAEQHVENVGEGGEQQENVGARSGLRSGVAQRNPETVALRVAERLLDLHAKRVHRDDLRRTRAQGRRQDPRLSSRSLLSFGTEVALRRTSLVLGLLTDPDDPRPEVGLTANFIRAELGRPAAGHLPEPLDVAPSFIFGGADQIQAANPGDVVPAVGQDELHPRRAEARVRHDDGRTRWENCLHVIQEGLVHVGFHVAADPVRLGVDDERSAFVRNRRDKRP
jgi:hypothetical protein